MWDICATSTCIVFLICFSHYFSVVCVIYLFIFASYYFLHASIFLLLTLWWHILFFCFMLLSHFLIFSHHIKLCCSPNKWLSLLVAQKVRSRNNFCSSNKTFALYSSGVFLHSKYFALSAIQNPNQHLQWCVCYDPPSAKVIPLWLVNC